MNQGPKQVQTMLVDAAQVVSVQGDAMAIKKIEDLDGDLPAVVNAVAKLSGGKYSIFSVSRDIGHDGYHFVNRLAQEKMIVRHFIRPSQTPGQFEKPADIAFRE